MYDPTAEAAPGQPGAVPGLPQSSPGLSGSGGAPGEVGIAFPGASQKAGEVSGLPIVGVKTLCKDKPFRVYKDTEEYARWLFSVFDLDQQVAGQQGQPPGAPPVGSGAAKQPGEGSRLPGTTAPPGGAPAPGGMRPPDKQ